jgi:CRISPR-associated endonuclease/helicase Cas3
MLSILNKLSEKGLDLSKETHPGKPYSIHIKECNELVNKLMREIYNYPEDIITFAFSFSELHDVGKLLPEWSLNRDKRPHHAIEGAEWFLREGMDIHVNSLHPGILAYAILTHHSPLYVPGEVEKRIDDAEKGKLRHFSKYSKCRALIGLGPNNINNLIRETKKHVRFDLADVIGIVKLADIISAKNIPLNDVLVQYYWPENLEEKLISGVSKRAYEKRGNFDSFKFERQVRIASSSERNLLVAAPTGWGKTTLALIRIIKLKPVKVFYVLPTITAIKDFYDTFTKILDKTYIGEYFYFVDVELLGRREGEEEGLFDIYRYFIPKINITTIDQLLLTTLQVGKYHIRRFNFRNSLLILDEFHLLTPQMLAGIRYLLKNLSEHYKISCLFMSATPSPVYEDLLKEALPHLEMMTLNDEYNRLKRHKIEYCDDKRIEDLIVEKQDLLRKERTLILVNTVGKAQKIYRDLKEDIGNSRNIVLIHGDYAYKDRAKKEEQINNADILVSTQVAEVSLDVSFNILITELSPIPSLVQRFGRVNRYGGTPNRTNVFICKPESPKPYGDIPINLADKNLPILITDLEKKGEEAYLNGEFWQYEQIYRGEVERMEKEISDKIDGDVMFNFFSFLAREDEILRMLGREETWLAIPKIYLENVLTLYKRFHGANYEERRRIYAQIKGYLAPVTRSEIRSKRVEWNEELNLPIIINYDEDIGIVRVD